MSRSDPDTALNSGMGILMLPFTSMLTMSLDSGGPTGPCSLSWKVETHAAKLAGTLLWAMDYEWARRREVGSGCDEIYGVVASIDARGAKVIAG
jgi:hypothetical protein